MQYDSYLSVNFLLPEIQFAFFLYEQKFKWKTKESTELKFHKYFAFYSHSQFTYSVNLTLWNGCVIFLKEWTYFAAVRQL